MNESISVSTVLSATPEKIYKAWLNSKEHAAFTGDKAKIDPKPGGKFSAWDGYITGTTLELVPYNCIVQSWRTTDFPEESADSRLEIHLEPLEGKTKLTLLHSEIPEGQGKDYEKGWTDYYFIPMQDYFK